MPGALHFVLAESRGARGRLLFFTLCIAIGVAAVVGVAGVSASLDAGVRAQSRDLLAADLSVEGRRPLPEGLDGYLADAFEGGFQRADVRELATMVARPPSSEAPDAVGPSRLAELKAVSAGYPFYGAVELEPPGSLGEALDAESALVAPDLAEALGVGLGDRVLIGGAEFRVAALVLDEPDRLDFSFTLGPRIFVSMEGLARTSLLGFGTQVKYRALYALSGDPTLEELRAVRDRMQEEIPDAGFLRIRTHADAQSGLRRGLDRFARYLGLVALLSLILGGIGVAQIVRTWLASRMVGIAVLRSIGLRPREILVLYLAHVALLALLGSLVGAAVGGVLPFLGPRIAPDLLPPDLVRGWQPGAMARGVGLGLGVALLFSLPALTAVWRVSPALVLRSDSQPLAAPRGVRYGALGLTVLGILGAAWIQGGELDNALWFTGGLAALALLLWAGAWGTMRLTSLVPRRLWNAYLLHGVAALARPGAGTVGAIVALGLGVLVVGSMVLVESRLEEELAGALPEEAPSSFLVDIQPDQWPGISALLGEAGAQDVDSVPVVMARLSAIDDRPVQELMDDRHHGRRRGRWVFTREQRLTWLSELPENNRLLEGELWSDPDLPEVSLEEGFAEDLDVGLGSKLTFDVQGIPIDLWVTSIRPVEWESFGINFFLVAEPGVLDDAPQFRIASIQLEDAREQELQDRLVAGYPNVTLLRIRPILEKVVDLLERLTLGVRLLGGFTIVVGLVILAGSVAATQVRRAREVALWKTLGVTRRGVALLFAGEFALTGLVAGALGGLGALALSWSFLEHVLELDANLPPASLLVASAGCAILSVAAGISACGRALAVRPMASLRAE